MGHIEIAADQSVRQLLRPLEPFLADGEVTEILVNKPGELWSMQFEGWQRHDVGELTLGYLNALQNTLTAYNKLEPAPIMYFVLPDGQRGTIIRPPACLDDQFAMNIRKHSPTVKSLSELAGEGAFDDWLDVSFNKPSEAEVGEQLQRHDFGRLEECEAELLRLKRDRQIIEFLARAVTSKRNIAIAGQTGSGKTTFARSLLECVPATERLVTIEDTHELMLPSHPNRLHLIIGKGRGRVSAVESLKACMRLTPDRIILAELRGDEAWEYISSLNTGHGGSVTTFHSNGALQAFQRVASLVQASEAGATLPADYIRRELFTTIDVTLFFRARKLVEVFYDPVFAKTHMGGK
jgi:type IV secretion system protein VirB11